MLERKFWLGGVPLFCLSDRAGDFRGTVLVYHGFRSHSEDQRKELTRLAQAGYLAVGVDAVDHGLRSRGDLQQLPRKAIQELVVRTAAEVPRLLDDLEELQSGLGNFAVVGTSMGGYVALRAALEEPRLCTAAPIISSPEWIEEERWSEFWPCALLLQNAGRDEYVDPEPARRLAEFLRPLYSEAPERLSYHEYPESGHFMREQDWNQVWDRVLGWLATHLSRA